MKPLSSLKIIFKITAIIEFNMYWYYMKFLYALLNLILTITLPDRYYYNPKATKSYID